MTSRRVAQLVQALFVRAGGLAHQRPGEALVLNVEADLIIRPVGPQGRPDDQGREYGLNDRAFDLPEIRGGGPYPAPMAIGFHFVDEVVHA
jgi:hypothetical protein